MFRVGARDERAFERVVERYGGAALGLAERICASRCQAEEAVQEAFFHIWQKAPTYRTPGNPRGWILTIVAREALKQVRATASRFRHEQWAALGRGESDPEPDSSQEYWEELRVALARLTPRERQLILLYFKAGLTQWEIGRVLLQSQRTVCRGLAAALQALRLQVEWARPGARISASAEPGRI